MLATLEAGVRTIKLLCPNLQRPLIVLWIVDALEAIIRRVSCFADRQQMQISMPNPCDLFFREALSDGEEIRSLEALWAG